MLRSNRQGACSSIADSLVDDVQQHLACGKPAEILAQDLVLASFAAGRLAGAMRRDDDIPRPECVALRQRLRIGHVEPSGGDLFGVQG